MELRDVRRACRDGAAPSWESLEPLLDAAEALATEADSLGTRAEQIFAAVNAPSSEDVAPPASSTDDASEVEPEDARHWWAGPPRRHSAVRVQAAVRRWLVRRRARSTGGCAEAGVSATHAPGDAAPARTRPWHALARPRVHARPHVPAWPTDGSDSTDEDYASAAEFDEEEVCSVRSTEWSCAAPTARRVPARGDG